MSLNQVEHDSSVWCLTLKLVNGLSALMERRKLADVALPYVLARSRKCLRKSQDGINPTPGRVRIGVAKNLRCLGSIDLPQFYVLGAMNDRIG